MNKSFLFVFGVILSFGFETLSMDDTKRQQEYARFAVLLDSAETRGHTTVHVRFDGAKPTYVDVLKGHVQNNEVDAGFRCSTCRRSLLAKVTCE